MSEITFILDMVTKTVPLWVAVVVAAFLFIVGFGLGMHEGMLAMCPWKRRR